MWRHVRASREAIAAARAAWRTALLPPREPSDYDAKPAGAVRVRCQRCGREFDMTAPAPLCADCRGQGWPDMPRGVRPTVKRERSHFSAMPCDGCGTAFTPVRAWHRHCSNKCRAQATRNRKAQALQAMVGRLIQIAGIGVARP
jgi:hypothetical protein